MARVKRKQSAGRRRRTTKRVRRAAPRKLKSLPKWLKSSARDIYALSKSKRKTTRQNILNTASDKTVHNICQCTADLMRKKLYLSPKHKTALKRNRKQIFNLLKPGKDIGYRRNVLQKGNYHFPVDPKP